MTEMVLVQPKAWRVLNFDHEYGADVSVECGTCGQIFNRTVPPLTHAVAICKYCQARNELRTDFADFGEHGWYSV